jgi:hypothetical protein
MLPKIYIIGNCDVIIKTEETLEDATTEADKAM